MYIYNLDTAWKVGCQMFSHGKCLDQTDPGEIAISAKGLVKGQ